MGVHVMVVYVPETGLESELVDEVRRHVPTLRRLGLATAMPSVALRAPDGTVIEHFEWTSREAMATAHDHPEVQAMWARFEACGRYGTFAELPNAGDLFAEFELLGHF